MPSMPVSAESHDIAYTLTVHDEKYLGSPDQVVGVFGGEDGANTAKAAAHLHWTTLAGSNAMALNFTSYTSSNTGHDFHVAEAYRDFVAGRVTYSVNGFTVQRSS